METTCFRPYLSSMDKRMFSWGCFEDGDRLMLKSPCSTSESCLDGDSCSRADSTLVRTETSAEDGGR